MGCGNNVSLLDEELGILPRAIRQLYESVEERSNQAEFLVFHLTLPKYCFPLLYNIHALHATVAWKRDVSSVMAIKLMFADSYIFQFH